MKKRIPRTGRYRTGVIALRFGGTHLSAYMESPHFEVVGICDIDERLLAEKAGLCGARVVTTDYRELLASPEIDVVSVTTPDFLHREMTEAALKAGKHVIVEKPLALTLPDCKAIVRAARNSSAQCMVGQVCRFAPGFVMAKGLIDKGIIGELFFVESEYAHDYAEVVGWNNWRKSREIGRDGVIGGGCHAVDLLRWIGGDVAEVTAYANHKMLTDWSQPDTTVACLKFRGKGLIGKVFVSIAVKRPYTMRSCFYGSEGSIVCDNTSPSLKLYTTKFPAMSDFVDVPVGNQSKNIPGEIEYFYEVLSGKRDHVLTALEGARTAATCLAIVKSARRGGMPTKVPDVD